MSRLVTLLSKRWLARIASPAAITPTLGEELVSNGDMTNWVGGNPSDWTVAGEDGANYIEENPAGQAHLVCTVSSTYLYMSQGVLIVGGWYLAGVYVTALASGAVRVGSSALFNIYTDTGSKAGAFRASGTTFVVARHGTCDLSVDNLSCKPISLPSCLGSAIQTASEGIWECTPTLTAGTQAGMMLCIDDPANPDNFVLAYHDGVNAKLEKKTTAGGYATLISAAATYSAGARLVVRKYGNRVDMFYNNALVGTVQTISDAGITNNTKHALFSTYSGNSFGTFIHWPAYPNLPSEV